MTVGAASAGRYFFAGTGSTSASTDSSLTPTADPRGHFSIVVPIAKFVSNQSDTAPIVIPAALK